MKMLDLVKTRYSVRNYLPNPVEQSKLDYIMECVRLAPSAVNFQPWRFFIITDDEKLKDIKSLIRASGSQRFRVSLSLVQITTNHGTVSRTAKTMLTLM